MWRAGELQPTFPINNLRQAFDAEDTLVWLDIEGDPAEAQKLLQTFGLSRLTIRTIGDEHERSKFVEGHNYFYLVMHTIGFDQRTEDATTPKVDIVFSKRFLLTLHREPTPYTVTD